MEVVELVFRAKHECPYRELSEEYPGLEAREWYAGECQIVEFETGEEPEESLLKRIEEMGEVLQYHENGGGVEVVSQSCMCPENHPVIESLHDNGCLYVPPTVHRNGWEQYKAIAFDDEDARDLLKSLNRDGEVEIFTKSPVRSKDRNPLGNLVPVGSLLGDLTGKQREALRIAMDSGYFEEPRGATVSDLAEKADVAVSTYEEHLRKAENRVMKGLGGFLRLTEEG